MKTRLFTMLEILVVVGIILILLGILVPATSTVLKKAKKSKTETSIRNLQIAIKQYEALYGFLPLTGDGVDEVLSVDINPSRLILFYRGLCADRNFIGPNPRQVNFLECETSNAGTPQLQDAWDFDFRIAMDLNYDGKIDAGSVYGYVNPGTSNDLNTSVAIWSIGPDGVESATSDTDSSNADNITSWD